MSKIQAVLFDKKYVTKKQAKEWLKKHNIKPIKKVHTTQYYHRYRIREPSEFKNFVYKKPNDLSHVSFIIGFP